MRFKTLNPKFIIYILFLLVASSVIFIPSTIVRVVFLIPFLLFLPGFVLVDALFNKKGEITGIERLALTVGMSIVAIGLIGFGLNYTALGIRLGPVVYSITAFIILFSAIALVRARKNKIKIIVEYRINLSGWGGGAFNKSLSVILVIVIFGAFGLLGYTIAVPKIGERFTEFYILRLSHEAQDYPIEYVMENGKVTQVIYSNGATDTTSGMGKITLGIVNHEQQIVNYSVQMTIDGEPVTVGASEKPEKLGPVELRQGDKWEQEIGIMPHHTGENQKVELLLFNGNNSLCSWHRVTLFRVSKGTKSLGRPQG